MRFWNNLNHVCSKSNDKKTQYSCEFESRSWRHVLDITLYDTVCQCPETGRWFSPVSSTNKIDRHDITEILLKVVFNTITLQL